MFCDSWATVEDMSDTLVERVHLSPRRRNLSPTKPVRQWEEWLGQRRHRFPQRSN